MKKKWNIERKWEASKVEIAFEKMLNKNGFFIVGIKEYASKTDYLIMKNGIDIEFTIPHIDDKLSRAKLCFKNFMEYFEIKKEYENLKKLLDK